MGARRRGVSSWPKEREEGARIEEDRLINSLGAVKGLRGQAGGTDCVYTGRGGGRRKRWSWNSASNYCGWCCRLERSKVAPNRTSRRTSALALTAPTPHTFCNSVAATLRTSLFGDKSGFGRHPPPQILVLTDWGHTPRTGREAQRRGGGGRAGRRWQCVCVCVGGVL